MLMSTGIHLLLLAYTPEKYACELHTYVPPHYYCILNTDLSLIHIQVQKNLQFLIIILLPYVCQHIYASQMPNM